MSAEFHPLIKETVMFIHDPYGIEKFWDAYNAKIDHDHDHLLADPEPEPEPPLFDIFEDLIREGLL
jgi:hypothetical protein